jgi:hypothetical protein
MFESIPEIHCTRNHYPLDIARSQENPPPPPPPPGTCSSTVMWGGKEWQRSDDGQGRIWDDAINYCENLVLCGLSDWRLPSIDELKGLSVCTTGFDGTFCNSGSQIPTIDPSFQCQASIYWSSTTSPFGTFYAMRVDFSDGSTWENHKSNYNYVRCVRGGQ